MGNRKAPHHRGTHDATSRTLRAAWTANPDTRCVKCGHTLAEGLQLYGANGKWDADHIQPGNSSAGYQPKHAHCNRSDGATLGNQRRASGYDWP